MKWFKHFSDAYSNIKIQHLIAEFGMEGYGFFWVCCELIAQQGDNFRLKSDKNWKKVLSHLTGVSDEKRDELLSHFGAVKLIDEKALLNNDLFIPKMQSYSDEYTDKLRRMSRHARDKVGLEQNRTDKKKNRTDVDTRSARPMRHSSFDRQAALDLAQLITGNTPTFKPPNIDAWADQVRLMREVDGRTEEQITFLVKWSQDSAFWRSNILSTKKLREKFDTLVAQVKRESDKQAEKKNNIAFS